MDDTVVTVACATVHAQSHSCALGKLLMCVHMIMGVLVNWQHVERRPQRGLPGTAPLLCLLGAPDVKQASCTRNGTCTQNNCQNRCHDLS